MYQIEYLQEPIKNIEDDIRYKLCCFYHAKTEIYDRGLTNIRSHYDPTEAFIDGGYLRSFSNRYVAYIRIQINNIAKAYGLATLQLRDLNDVRYSHYSAQRWIDEYNRLEENGEMDFIKDFIGDDEL